MAVITRRSLLAALAVLALGPSASTARKKKKNRPPYPPLTGRVPVFDYTSPVWEGVVEETVEDYNAIMPDVRRAPRLIYVRKPERACDDLPRKKRPNSIALCSTQDEDRSYTWLRRTIHLSDRTHPTIREAVACHELGHLILRLGDNYHTVPYEERAKIDSCLWGGNYQDDPGAFDQQRLQEIYAKRRFR